MVNDSNLVPVSTVVIKSAGWRLTTDPLGYALHQ
jgi:hypothetical protein